MIITENLYGRRLHNGSSDYDYFIPFGPGVSAGYIRGAWFKDGRIAMEGDNFLIYNWEFMTDKKSVLDEIREERERQDKKWGVQKHHPYKWLAILGEEVGEANKAVFEADFNSLATNHDWEKDKNKMKDYRAELIQVAAVAVAMIESLDSEAK